MKELLTEQEQLEFEKESSLADVSRGVGNYLTACRRTDEAPLADRILEAMFLGCHADKAFESELRDQLRAREL